MTALAILLSIMVGCSKDSNSTNGNGGNSGGSEQTGGTDANPFAEHIDISVSTFNIGKAFPDRNTKQGDTYTITRDKNEEGEFVSIGSLYPSFNMFGSLAAWYQWMEFTESEAVDIAYGAELARMSREELKHRVENYEPVPTNFKVELLHTPAKAKLSAINVAEDIIRIMLAKEDPVAMWKETVRGYDNKGLQKAIEEVNEAVQARGLDN